MSAPSLFRPVEERRVSVVRDVAAVGRVLADDPVGSCMVSSEGACAAHYTYGRYRDV